MRTEEMRCRLIARSCRADGPTKLVPPHEGCRLPLRIGAPPVASWLAPNVGDLPPSLHGHYTRFNATTRQSAPFRRIGTFGLAVGAACAFFPWHRRSGSHVPYKSQFA